MMQTTFCKNETLGLHLVYVLLATLAIVITISLLMAKTDTFGSEGGKGPKVFLTVDTNHVGQEASIGTYQYGWTVDTRYNYVNNGITEITLNYQKGQTENGQFQIRVRLNDGEQGCGNGYNGEAKKPEHVRVKIYSDGSPQSVPSDQSQAQSSNNENNNENNNAQSQSQDQDTTIYICGDRGCFPQQ